MTVKELYDMIDRIAPFSTQMEGDNSGFLVGSAAQEVTGILFALDVTEPVSEEAAALGAPAAYRSPGHNLPLSIIGGRPRNGPRGRRAQFSPSSGSCCRQCSVKLNSVPAPFSLATHMSSSMRRSNSLAMDRPRPLPLPLWALSTL